jgi:hypothetical protein
MAIRAVEVAARTKYDGTYLPRVINQRTLLYSTDLHIELIVFIEFIGLIELNRLIGLVMAVSQNAIAQFFPRLILLLAFQSKIRILKSKIK